MFGFETVIHASIESVSDFPSASEIISNLRNAESVFTFADAVSAAIAEISASAVAYRSAAEIYETARAAAHKTESAFDSLSNAFADIEICESMHAAAVAAADAAETAETNFADAAYMLANEFAAFAAAAEFAESTDADAQSFADAVSDFRTTARQIADSPIFGGAGLIPASNAKDFAIAERIAFFEPYNE